MAVLGSQIDSENGGPPQTVATPLSSEHNARHHAEQSRLCDAHPNETVQGLVRCKSAASCYVKGHLQPSRSLGDAYLKYHEFRPGEGANTALLPYTNKDPARTRRVRAPFSPPYVLTDPEIQHTTLHSQQDDFLILASDGLWDEMTPEEAVAHCYSWRRERRENTCGSDATSGVASESASGSAAAATSLVVDSKNSNSAASFLIKRALEHAAEESGQTLKEVMELSPGKRRHVHDDITVIVVELKKRERRITHTQH